MKLLLTFLSEHLIPFQQDVDLKTKTWIRRGGVAKLWIQPVGINQLKLLVEWLQTNEFNFEVIGNSSNCYFKNNYSPEVVISTLRVNNMRIEKDSICCDCGFSMTRLAHHCNKSGIKGYEGFVGLPGTVAGAAINNAGCYGSLTADRVIAVDIIQNGKLRKITKEQLAYTHRSSALKRKEIVGVVLSVYFDISQKDDVEVLQKRAEYYKEQRRKFQEHTFPNLGTVFCELNIHRPFVQKVINKLCVKAYELFATDRLQVHLFSVKLFWWFNGGGNFKHYVSIYGIQCFTWKDDGADRAFDEYVKFIREKSENKAVMEIEIKDCKS